MRFWKEYRPAIHAAAPWTAALLTLAAGVMLLASGVTPSEPYRFMRLLEITPVVLIEVSHFASSIMGLVLVMLAFGLRARLDGAWAASMLVLLVAAPLSLVKGFIWEETAVLVGLAANAAVGAWWLDPLIGLFIAFVAVKEGREAWRGEACAACSSPLAAVAGADDCCSDGACAHST